MIKLILTQIIVCIIQYYIATTEKTKNIFLVTFLFNFFNGLCYYLNKDMPTVYFYIVICVRSFIYIYKDKIKIHKWHPIIPFLFIGVQIVVGILTLDNYWQLIPMIMPCYVCYYMWFYYTTQKLRIGNIIGNSAWFIYNTVTGLYIVAAGRLITVVMNLITYIKRRRSEYT